MREASEDRAVVMPNRQEIRPVLLRVLRELGGRARPRDVVPEVTRAFPNLTKEDLEESQPSDPKSNKWRNRVHWARQDLVYSGQIDNSEQGWWVLAESASLPLPEPEPLPDDPVVEDDPLQAVAEDPPTFRIVADPTESIALELEKAGRDSRSPQRLEEAVKDAMEFLGFDAETIGGSGQTDVIASAPLGKNRYSLVLDAKSTSSGRVGLSQVDMLSITAHQSANDAQFAVVVGPGFAHGELHRRAVEQRVCLLTTSALAELVRIHGATPVTLKDIRHVFEQSPDGAVAIPDVRNAAEDRLRKQKLLVRVLELIDQLNRSQPDLVLARPEALLATISTETHSSDPPVQLADVRQALSLLATLGAISETNDGGYTSETSLRGALGLLSALGNAIHIEPAPPRSNEAAAGGAQAG